MIKNERQLRIAERELRELEASLAANRDRHASMPSERAALLRSGVESVIGTLVDEIMAYRKLHEDPPSRIHYSNLAELPAALIRARIASGLTQSELADRVGIHENQIQKYEANDFEHANLVRLREIEAALPILQGPSTPAEHVQ